MNEFDRKIVEIKSGKGQYDAACSYINQSAAPLKHLCLNLVAIFNLNNKQKIKLNKQMNRQTKTGSFSTQKLQKGPEVDGLTMKELN